MNRSKTLLSVAALAAGTLLLVGCQPAQRRADAQQIPRVSKLVAKATASPRVHRFRKPLRDEQARVLRQLAIECDRLAGGLRDGGVSAEALTGSADAGSLETALGQLAAAARSGDIRAIRSNHATALNAYSRTQSRTAPPKP